jgi:hypothetical protein
MATNNVAMPPLTEGLQVAVLLTDMAGNELGGDGDFSPWE